MRRFEERKLVAWLEMKRNMCGNKKGYETRAKAEFEALDVSEKTGASYNTYRCNFCNKFHFGHARKSAA